MSPLDLRTLKISWPVRILLVITLGLIALAWWRGRDSGSVPPVEAVSRKPASASAVPAAGRPASGATLAGATTASGGSAPLPDAAASSAASTAIVDLFPSQNWQPPPPPAPPPAPASTRPLPPPEPPPLPFMVRSLWLGSAGDFYVVLVASGREFSLCDACKKRGFLHKGDVMLNVYRIEDINRQAVKLEFLPLKRHQQLPLGGPR